MLKKLITFIRWRLVLTRYLTIVFNLKKASFKKKYKPTFNASLELDALGVTLGPKLNQKSVDEIFDIYSSKIKKVVPNNHGAPFMNLIVNEDIHDQNPILKLAFSKEVLDSAFDYFGGKVILDSIQLLYSWPTEGELRESQKWHLDYGDSKSFHCITYLNNVNNIDNGPFVYIDKVDSKKIKWSPFVRRIQDLTIEKELNGLGKIKSFVGNAGDSIFVDPAVCYHYGSRCKIPRLAIFITFNSSLPFVSPTKLIKSNKNKLFEIGKFFRPDLKEVDLKNLLRL